MTRKSVRNEFERMQNKVPMA